MSRNPSALLWDIDESAEAIVEYTAVHHLPELRRTVEALLAELDSAPPPPSADREEK